MIIAILTSIDLVDTQVAIALGASVQPFTKITPKVNRVVTQKAGLLAKRERKSPSAIVISPLSFHSFPG
jgi:hypothetical protein